MKQSIRLLALLFAVQLVILGSVYLATRPQADQARPLVGQALQDADQILITEGDSRLILKRTEGQWLIEDYGQLPAADSQVAELVEELEAISIHWPVATSASAAERFEVTEGTAKKTLQFLKQDQQLFSLYIGSSPGFRKQHVSLNGQEVYSVELAEHRISASAEDWLDKDILKLEASVISAQFDELTVTQQDDSWALAELNDGEQSNTDAIKRWIDRFSNLQVSGYIAPDEAANILVTDADITVRLTTTESETGYNIYSQDESYFIKRFGDDNLFMIAAYQAEPILEVSREDFLVLDSDSEEATAP
jgi:hypothetical protein